MKALYLVILFYPDFEFVFSKQILLSQSIPLFYYFNQINLSSFIIIIMF